MTDDSEKDTIVLTVKYEYVKFPKAHWVAFTSQYHHEGVGDDKHDALADLVEKIIACEERPSGGWTFMLPEQLT